MKHLILSPQVFRTKRQTARTDVPSVSVLRGIPLPSDRTSFLIGRALYVFDATDLTPDDGASVIRPTAVAPGSPGRYRLPSIVSPWPSNAGKSW